MVNPEKNFQKTKLKHGTKRTTLWFETSKNFRVSPMEGLIYGVGVSSGGRLCDGDYPREGSL
jgi:hypothetical protein